MSVPVAIIELQIEDTNNSITDTNTSLAYENKNPILPVVNKIDFELRYYHYQCCC